MKTIAILFLSVAALFLGCRTTMPRPSDGVSTVRQALEDLPEPTFQSLEVYTHDLSAKGVALLCEKYPDVRVPLRIFADGAISVLEEQQITMLDVITLSTSLDSIKEGKVKTYLDLAWTLLELNGVVRRDDLTATLTEREQKLLLALFHGIRLGTDTNDAERDRILNSYGPRYGD